MKIDSSQLQTYINCPRLYFNKYVLQIRKSTLDEGEQSRSFGQCIHKALEIWQVKSLDEAIAWFKASYVSLPDEKLRSTDNGIALIKQYVKWESVNLPNMETLETEVKDEYDIDDIKYIVKIDRIVRFSGNVYGVDYKSSTSNTRLYFLNFDINMQVDGYCNYIRKKYGSCAGFLPIALQMNYIDKPKLFDVSQENEAKMYQFNETKYCKYHKKDMIYAWGFNSRIDYDIVNRTKEDLEHFEKNVIVWTDKLKKDMELIRFPQNTKHCSSYYGCMYKDLCKSLFDESIMSELYEECDAYEYLNEDNNDSN